jgi:regulator of RNase E activity RraA
MTLAADDTTRLCAAGTSGVSDAMERLALPRSAITGFRCTSAAPIVGSAFTIRQVPKHHPATRDQRLVRHGEVSADLAQAGDFVVVDAGGRRDIAAWGGNHSRRCHDRGVSAVLVNGSTRDLAEIRQIGFPTFHLSTSPVASRWDQETAELGGCVVIGGVQIRAGDILLGDEDGLIVVAPGLLDKVLEALR